MTEAVIIKVIESVSLVLPSRKRGVSNERCTG